MIIEQIVHIKWAFSKYTKSELVLAFQLWILQLYLFLFVFTNTEILNMSNLSIRKVRLFPISWQIIDQETHSENNQQIDACRSIKVLQ